MSRSRQLVLALCIAVLPGCASKPPQPVDRRQAIEAARASGYLSARSEVQGWQATWEVGGQQVDVAWLAPKTARQAPLLVYLPGMGEDARAGELWRHAWAEAGYAVLSLQPRQFGRALYSSPQAQAGSFRNLARDIYATEALQTRLLAVEAVLAEARRRALAGDVALAGVDWQQWAVAGFDLGAQTAAALAGERETQRLSSLRPSAVVLLSPYVADGTEVKRFASLDTPVLAVSGPHDEDPLGWVSSAGQRESLWRGLQVQGSYRLLALSAEHAELSGNVPEPMGARGRGEGRPSDGPPGGPSDMPLGFDAGGGRGAPPGGQGPGGRSGPGQRMGRGGGMEASFDPRQVANVQAVSLAFLDWRVRKLSAAEHWLKASASEWMAGSALLEEKP